MTYEEIKEIMDMENGNVICKKFCVFPSQIAQYIESVAYGYFPYGYVLIGAIKEKADYCIYGINADMNMENVIEHAFKKVNIKTKISYEICKINNKSIYIIKVKTCDKINLITSSDIVRVNEILGQLILACIRLQANSIYYGATEDQRNDYIRDILSTVGYDIKDQTRQGLSPGGKGAGEVDILIKENGFPIAIIEALNLSSLNSSYLDIHIDKIFDYDTAGNKFNIILSYVTVANFETFYDKYLLHIKEHIYPVELVSIEEDVDLKDISFSNIKIIKGTHRRSGCETILFHVCVLIK